MANKVDKDETDRYLTAPSAAFALGAETGAHRALVDRMQCMMCYDVPEVPFTWSACNQISCLNCVELDSFRRCPQCQNCGNGCKAVPGEMEKMTVATLRWKCESCKTEGYGVKDYHLHFKGCAGALREAYVTSCKHSQKMLAKVKQVELECATQQERMEIIQNELDDANEGWDKAEARLDSANDGWNKAEAREDKLEENLKEAEEKLAVMREKLAGLPDQLFAAEKDKEAAKQECNWLKFKLQVREEENEKALKHSNDMLVEAMNEVDLNTAAIGKMQKELAEARAEIELKEEMLRKEVALKEIMQTGSGTQATLDQAHQALKKIATTRAQQELKSKEAELLAVKKDLKAKEAMLTEVTTKMEDLCKKHHNQSRTIDIKNATIKELNAAITKAQPAVKAAPAKAAMPSSSRTCTPTLPGPSSCIPPPDPAIDIEGRVNKAARLA